MCEQVFEPLEAEEQEALARRIVEALENCPGHSLPPERGFPGAGIYALYYFGHLALYSALAKRNAAGQLRVPIYVGKANLRGARTARSSATRQTPLYDRLREHAESIEAVRNLSLRDFKCRYLVLNQMWVTLGEQILIRRFSPLWNAAIEGFGIHHPGGGRAGQQRSQWDTLHPGRKWVERLNLPPNRMTKEELRRRVREYLSHLTEGDY